MAARAFAQPPTTVTTHEKGLVETFVDVIPTCEEDGPLYTITTTSNLVMHETIFDDGRVHATFTQTGKFVAVPLEDPSLPSFTGRFTQWGGFNQNGIDGERHVDLQSSGEGFGRVDVSARSGRALQRATRRHGQRVLPLPLAQRYRGSDSHAPGLAEPLGLLVGA